MEACSARPTELSCDNEEGTNVDDNGDYQLSLSAGTWWVAAVVFSFDSGQEVVGSPPRRGGDGRRPLEGESLRCLFVLLRGHLKVRSADNQPVIGAVGLDESTQNSLPSGSAMTTQLSDPLWPMSAWCAPSRRRRSTSAA